MDHASAHLMEFSRDLHSSKTIESEFTHEAKVHSIGKSEHGMHNKEQHQQADYYKKLGDVIKIIPQGRGPQVTRSEHEVSEVALIA